MCGFILPVAKSQGLCGTDLNLCKLDKDLIWCVLLDFLLLTARTNRQTEQKRNGGRG